MRRFSTIISPACHNHFLDLIFPTSLIGFDSYQATEMIMRCKANPLPSTACKGNILADFMMILEVTIVFLLAILIIIPINQGHSLFKAIQINSGFFWNFHITVVLTICRHEFEEHIAPHLTVEAILICNIQDSLKVLAHEKTAILETMLNQITSETDQVGFVHADINLACTQMGHGLEHTFD